MKAGASGKTVFAHGKWAFSLQADHLFNITQHKTAVFYFHHHQVFIHHRILVQICRKNAEVTFRGFDIKVKGDAGLIFTCYIGFSLDRKSVV